MMRLLTAAVLLSLAAPAAAQSPPICMPIDDYRQRSRSTTKRRCSAR